MVGRRKLPLITKLAATLLELGHVSRDEAKGMDAKSIVAKYQFDHIVLHALTANDHPSNVQPMLLAQHREKSKGDTTKVAKSKRIAKAQAAHHTAIRAKLLAPSVTKQPETKVRQKPKWGSRPLQSRNTFQKKRVAQ